MDTTVEKIKIESALQKYAERIRNIQPEFFICEHKIRRKPIPVICFKDEDFDSFEDFYRICINMEHIPDNFFLTEADYSSYKDEIRSIVKIKGEFYISKDFNVDSSLNQLQFDSALKIKYEDMNFAVFEAYGFSAQDLILKSDHHLSFFLTHYPSLIFKLISHFPSFEAFHKRRGIDFFPKSELDYIFFSLNRIEGVSFCEQPSISAMEFYLEGINTLSEDFAKNFLNFQVSIVWNERLRLKASGESVVELIGEYFVDSTEILANVKEWIDILKAICYELETKYSSKGIERSKKVLKDWNCNIKSEHWDFIPTKL